MRIHTIQFQSASSEMILPQIISHRNKTTKQNRQLSYIFRHICVSHKKCLLAWTCLSPSLHLFIQLSVSIVSTWLSLNKLSWNLILDTFIHIFLKPHKNIGHFTRRTKYVYIVESNTKYFVAWQQGKANPLLHFHGNTQQFYTAHHNMQHNNTKETHCCILNVALSICLYCWQWHT
jgi:hypothetical protein